jgi:AmmeMemoRadiSam system protein A
MVTLSQIFRDGSMVTPEEGRELLAIAREAIANALALGRQGARWEMDQRFRSRGWKGRLAEPSGAFVTIRQKGELRGCIGYIESPHPLALVVSEVAVKAATEDPRFAPMTQSDLARATLEVSILTPLRQITDVSEIEVGTHGLLLELGRHRGLLLPQVASEYGWDRETFLESTARKAGLPGKAWKDPDANIFIFSAEIVSEEE